MTHRQPCGSPGLGVGPPGDATSTTGGTAARTHAALAEIRDTASADALEGVPRVADRAADGRPGRQRQVAVRAAPAPARDPELAAALSAPGSSRADSRPGALAPAMLAMHRAGGGMPLAVMR